MINKNKFSIKNTKKVLHKVGKQWVVVSAVLLGLVAGGAAVNETANAQANTSVGTTEAPQNNMNAAKAKAQNVLAKHHLPTTSAAAKSDFTKYADVNHLADVASVARANNASSAYSNLVDLANNTNRFVSYSGNTSEATVGSDETNNSDNNTLFSMFDQASSDVNTINSGADKNGKVNRAASAFSKANSYATKSKTFSSGSNFSNTVSIPSMSVDISSTLSGNISTVNAKISSLDGLLTKLNSLNGHSSEVSLSSLSVPNNMSLSLSSFNSSIDVKANISSSISVPSLINSGYTNIPGSIESMIVSAADSASVAANSSADNIINAGKSNLESQISGEYNTRLSSGISNLNGEIFGLIHNISSIASVSPNSSLISANSSSVSNTISNDETSFNSVSNEFSNISNLTSDATSATEHGSITAAQQDQHEINLLRHGQSPAQLSTTISKDIKNLLSDNLADMKQVQNTLTESGINNFADEKINSAVNSKVSQLNIPSAINKELGLSNGQAATSGSGVVTEAVNNIVDPLNDAGISNVGPFKSDKATLGNIANSLEASEGAVNTLISMASSFANNKGKKLPISSSTADSAINKVVGLLNQANSGMATLATAPNLSSSYNDMSDEYSNAVSAAATLASPYNYGSQYPAYDAIYTNTSNLMSNLTALSALASGYNKGNIPHYAGLSSYANSAIVGEAGSIANSMSSTSSTIQSASDAVSGYINSVGNIFNNASASSALANAQSYADDINSISGAYYNSLSNGSVSANNASLDAKNAMVPVSTTSGGSTSGNDIPFVFPSTNNINYNVVPTNTNTVTPEINKKHAANYVKVIKALQLHTSPNFTKRNAVAVVKPGTEIKIEKSVKAHNGALRYEVRYNKKNYFITANKHWVSAYYKAAKHVNYRYTKVIKALQLHTSAKFTKRNGVKVVKPGTELRIDNVVKNHGLARYEVRYQGHNYFITANSHFTVNAYLQKSNFSKRGYKAVRAIKPVNEYRHVNFTKRGLVRHFRRGTVLPVRRVLTIGKGEVTRLQLTNGRYVSANKNLVNVIK